jgi:hypothetical protein
MSSKMLEQITEHYFPKKKGFEISIKGDFPVIIVAQVLLNQILVT